jgi:hypothetical protein
MQNHYSVTYSYLTLGWSLYYTLGSLAVTAEVPSSLGVVFDADNGSTICTYLILFYDTISHLYYEIT